MQEHKLATPTPLSDQEQSEVRNLVRSDPEAARQLWALVGGLAKQSPEAADVILQSLVGSVVISEISERVATDDEYARHIAYLLTEILDKLAVQYKVEGTHKPSAA